MIILDQKHPTAVLDYGIEFVGPNEAEVLSDPEVTVGDGLTLEESPAPAFLGDNRTVVFWLSGGTSGETYNVTVSCTSNVTPRRYVLNATIFVFNPAE